MIAEPTLPSRIFVFVSLNGHCSDKNVQQNKTKIVVRLASKHKLAPHNVLFWREHK